LKKRKSWVQKVFKGDEKTESPREFKDKRKSWYQTMFTKKTPKETEDTPGKRDPSKRKGRQFGEDLTSLKMGTSEPIMPNNTSNSSSSEKKSNNSSSSTQKEEKDNSKNLNTILLKCNGIHLDLSNCNLTIIPNTGSLAQSLISLDITSNQFKEFPLFNTFESLLTLDISKNQIVSIPGSSMLTLTNLRTLRLSQNKLIDLPEEIGQLAFLERLTLSGNDLKELAKGVGLLKKLEVLHLDGNQITTLPPDIGNCDKLEQLDISNCQLVNLPDEFTCLTRLTTLNLSSNFLTKLPWCIGKMTRLIDLNVEDNKLEDLPLSLGYCKGLGSGKGINLGKNKIKSEKMMKNWEGGSDVLMDYLYKRLSDAHFVPDWNSLKKVKPPGASETREELAYKQHNFVDDISTNADMQNKAVTLRNWSTTALEDINKNLGSKHLAFMTTTTIEEAKEKSVSLEAVYEQLSNAKTLLPPSEVTAITSRLTSPTIGSNDQLNDFYKTIGFQVQTSKVLLQLIGKQIEKTGSSKQLLFLVKILKSTD